MERLEIKKLLPTGYRKELALRTKLSLSYIDMWFYGKRDSSKIENAVLQYLAEVLEETKILKARIKAAL